MVNDDCLKIFDEDLALKVQDQLTIFNKRIKSISHKQPRGGPSIQEGIDLCKQILRSRVDHILTTLGNLPFEYSDDLSKKISDISLKYLPSDFADFRPGIEEIIRIGSGSRVRDWVFNEVARSNETEVQRFRNGLDKFLLNIKNKEKNKIRNLKEWAGGDHVNLAIVFTDVVGSIELGQELGGEKWEEVRQAHFEQTRRLLEQYKGWEIKTMGDGFMVAFRNIADALDFARELYLNTGYAQIKIRVGIHIGPVQIKDNDAHNDTVIFASRIISSIEDSEIWMSNLAKEQIDQFRADRHRNLRWNRLEGIEMKGLSGKHTLWSLAL